MTGYLVDTNVPSELTRPIPNERVVEFLREAGRHNVYLCVLSLGEICKGIAELPESRRRSGLQAWLDDVLRPWFEDRVLPVTALIAELCGALTAQASGNGKPLPVIDGLLAATAFEHQLTFVTRNTKDVTGLGLTILNPWEWPHEG